MSGEYQALAVAIHRTLCDSGPVTPAADHPSHYDEARSVIKELLKWQVHVIHISPVDEFVGLVVAADGSIAIP